MVLSFTFLLETLAASVLNSLLVNPLQVPSRCAIYCRDCGSLSTRPTFPWPDLKAPSAHLSTHTMSLCRLNTRVRDFSEVLFVPLLISSGVYRMKCSQRPDAAVHHAFNIGNLRSDYLSRRTHPAAKKREMRKNTQSKVPEITSGRNVNSACLHSVPLLVLFHIRILRLWRICNNAWWFRDY